MLRKTRFPQKYRFNLLIYINLILYLERNNSVRTELNALFGFMASVILAGMAGEAERTAARVSL